MDENCSTRKKISQQICDSRKFKEKKQIVPPATTPLGGGRTNGLDDSGGGCFLLAACEADNTDTAHSVTEVLTQLGEVPVIHITF